LPWEGGMAEDSRMRNEPLHAKPSYVVAAPLLMGALGPRGLLRYASGRASVAASAVPESAHPKARPEPEGTRR
jgi:hypothetical protein